MSADAVDLSRFSKDLTPGERILWTGNSGFALSSHPATTLICLLLTAYFVKTTWMLGTMAEFCDGRNNSKCGSFYLIVPLCMMLLTLGAVFDWLERLLVETGRATVEIVLTDSRLIRIAVWPWRRVRARNYHEHTPKIGVTGLVNVGRNYGFALARSDAAKVMELMSQSRRATP